MRSYPYPYNAFITEILDESEFNRIILSQIADAKPESFEEMKANILAMHHKYGLSEAGLEVCIAALSSRLTGKAAPGSQRSDDTQSHSNIVEENDDKTILTTKTMQRQLYSRYPKVETNKKHAQTPDLVKPVISDGPESTMPPGSPIISVEAYPGAINDGDQTITTHAQPKPGIRQASLSNAPPDIVRPAGQMNSGANPVNQKLYAKQSTHRTRTLWVGATGLAALFLVVFQLFKLNFFEPSTSDSAEQADASGPLNHRTQSNLPQQPTPGTPAKADAKPTHLKQFNDSISTQTSSQQIQTKDTSPDKKSVQQQPSGIDNQSNQASLSKTANQNIDQLKSAKQINQRVAKTATLQPSLLPKNPNTVTAGTLDSTSLISEDRSQSQTSSNISFQSDFALSNNSTLSGNSQKNGLVADQPSAPSEAEAIFRDLLNLAQDLNIEPASSPDTALGKLSKLKKINPSYQGLDRAYQYISRGYLALSKLAHAEQDPSRSDYLLGESIKYQAIAQKIKRQGQTGQPNS